MDERPRLQTDASEPGGGSPRQCDHYVGWLHFHGYARNSSAPRRRPRIVRQSQVDDVVGLYRFELVQKGASYSRAYAMPDALVFALCCFPFLYCPLCGVALSREAGIEKNDGREDGHDDQSC
ncbi:hypothetical protein [Noviherbaspirillum galbum]|uniref:Uncharacterized protein n=1 Tax=Noviherbaspirillum galbum TaxID=2709383 RepID=A0A6B3SX63_9BURK|nr:hypothetical protein [Noviherbaspirillum galbum]NEX63052.1 hypothetical protein [Noviherbaspirillum galbum]